MGARRMAKRTLGIPIRKPAAPGRGFRFGDLEPQTARQWLHIQYARMYHHQLMRNAGLNRGVATGKAVRLLTDLDSGRRQITEFRRPPRRNESARGVALTAETRRTARTT